MIYDDLMLFFLGYEKCCENFASKNSKPKKEKKEEKRGGFYNAATSESDCPIGGI